MRINCLEPKIFNKIAAGEVVERPASIVKELVENSIDAGATLITVKIENGGLSKISITDNGCGIHFDDLKTAFLPHATSKIKDENDLFSIKTLGFRGEALASIAAVSEVSLVSKEPNSVNGGKIEISGGTVVCPPEITGCADGTEITVSNLFFNVPARAKFLKKPKTEEGEITTLLTKFILANPMISFKYIIDGKIKFLSSGKGMKDALFVIYGKEVVDNTIELDADFGYIKIYGFIGRPTISKPNRTYQTIMINNRVIENITISSAVQNAYGETLMKKQFPLFALYIDIDYEMVDVNVHPNKKEIRFENAGDIYSKVYEVVNRALNRQTYSKSIVTEDEPIKPTIKPREFSYSAPTEVQLFNSLDTPTPAPVKIIDYDKVNDNLSKSSKDDDKTAESIINAMGILRGDEEDYMADGVRVGSNLLNQLTQKMTDNEQVMIDGVDSFTSKVVGTIFNTYIIVEKDDNMYMVDQHAGHERLLFDRLNKQLESSDVEIQHLLLPYVLSLNTEEYIFIQSILPNLKRLGFELEAFGQNTYKVESVPYILSSIDIKAFFESILSDTKSLQSIELKDILKDKLASLACKSAVKAGDRLDEMEIKKLLSSFLQGGNKLLCPHGRPVVINISKKEIEKWFKRIV